MCDASLEPFLTPKSRCFFVFYFIFFRNEQFKTGLGIRVTVQQLWKDMGWRFFARGLGKNMIAVAMPIGCTIFLTDAFIQYTEEWKVQRNTAAGAAAGGNNNLSTSRA